MSYFNDEQTKAMDYISSLPDEAVCWCGWGEKGNCPTPFPCDPNFSLADRKKVTCPECLAAPHKPNGVMYHRRHCSQHNVISK